MNLVLCFLVPIVAAANIDPVEFLHKYRYLKPGRTANNDLTAAIKDMQRFAHIPVSGKLDAKTITIMNSPRCGVPDHLSATYRQAKWPKNSLTYRFENYSPDLGQGETRRIIAAALQVWADVTPLRFIETTGTADINIRFQGFQHGCGYPFDGPGGVLAHAFFPTDGRSHFDESETFTDGTDQGTNLFWVAAHEFGHALGLSHSNVFEALMYPYYKGYKADFKLPYDDIYRIQQLYGSNPRPSQGPVPPTHAPVTDSSCLDDQVHGTNCDYYTKNGFCRTHRPQMEYYCKKSCGWC